MMFQRGLLSILLCVTPGSLVSAQSTSCDPNLKQEAQPQGYRQRGDRCEGYFIQPVAGGRLDIQSFAQARRIEVAGKSELTLGWPSFGSEAVQVRAYSLSPKEYYRMDTVRPSGQTSYTWPVAIPASRNLAVGLVSWTKALVGPSSETVYLPVSVAGAASGTYTITLIPSVTADQVYVTIAAMNPDGSKGRILKNRESLNLGYYPAFRSIPVNLPPLPAGLYRADFAASWENGSSATAGMYFYSAGPAKPGGAVTDQRRLRLDELVAQHTRALLDEAVLTGGTIARPRLDALVDLRTLAEMQPRHAPPSRRWIPALVMVLTLALMSGLLFIRVPSTEIELEIQATGVTFRVPTSQPLIEGTPLALLGADGLRRVRMAGDRSHAEQLLVMEQADEGFVRLSSRRDGTRDGTITLAGITLPAMTAGSLRYAGVPNRFRLNLAAADLDVRADVEGPVTAAVAGGGVEEMDFEVPEAVDLRGGRETSLDLKFRDIEESGFSSQFQVDDLSFIRIDERRDTEHSAVRELSTVVSGTLYMESLNGEKRELRAAELLQFRGVGGDILAMRVMPDRISLRFRGQVSDIVAGTPQSRRSLMPTLLEWARAQHGVSLLWGGSLYMFGIIVSLLRWLKVSV